MTGEDPTPGPPRHREERCELRSPGSSIGGSGTLSGCLLTGRGWMVQVLVG